MIDINRLRELLIGRFTYGDDGENTIITDIHENDDELTFDIHQEDGRDYVNLPLFPYLDGDYIEFDSEEDKEEVYNIITAVEDDLDESLKNDRNTLKRLVESYGKEDILKYVKQLNEGDENVHPSVHPSKIDYYIENLHIDLNNVRPISFNDVDENFDELFTEFEEEDGLLFCHNLAYSDDEYVPVKLSMQELHDILSPMLKHNLIDEEDFNTIISRFVELHKPFLFNDFNDFADALGDIMDHAYINAKDNEDDAELAEEDMRVKFEECQEKYRIYLYTHMIKGGQLNINKLIKTYNPNFILAEGTRCFLVCGYDLPLKITEMLENTGGFVDLR